MDNLSQRDILLYMANTIGAAGVTIILASKEISQTAVGLVLCLVSAGMIWFRKQMKIEDYNNSK